MKNISRITLLIFLLILSCKENSKEIVTETNINVKGIIENNTEKSERVNNVTSFLSEIDNKKLIPLNLINEDAGVYKKYQIDFYAVCMCDSQSMLINTKDSIFTIFDYCYGDMPNNKEISSEYQIKKIEETKDQMKVHLKTPEKELYLKIKKTKDVKIYKIEIIGSYPFYNRLKDYKFYSFLSDQKLFSKEDCGDFDG